MHRGGVKVTPAVLGLVLSTEYRCVDIGRTVMNLLGTEDGGQQSLHTRVNTTTLPI